MRIFFSPRNIFFILLFTAVFFSCYIPTRTLRVETSTIKLDSISVITEDSHIKKIIEPFKTRIDSEMSEIIGYSEHLMIKNLPEGILNNFIADLILYSVNEYYTKEKADVCLLNSGGLRSSLPRGAITKGKIYELMPFENNIVILTLSGEATKNMFNSIAKKGGAPFAGFTMGIKDTVAVNVLINNKPFDIHKTYRVATSDYLSSGGDDTKYFSNPIKQELTGTKVRDIIIRYIKEETAKGNTLKSKLDKRIYYE